MQPAGFLQTGEVGIRSCAGLDRRAARQPYNQ